MYFLFLLMIYVMVLIGIFSDHDEHFLTMDDAMENKINQEIENNNNENKRHSSKYEDMTGSQGFRIGSLIPPEASYANTDSNTNSKVVELDEDGNELGELPQLPPKRLLSRYMSLPVEDEEQMGELIPSPGVEEEQICLSPGTPDDVDGGYLEPQTGHLYEEIKEVKRIVEVTPTGSRIFTVEERTRKVPLMRRLTSRMGRKNTIDSDDENVKCTCSKKNLLLVAILIAILLLLVIAIVVAVVITREKKSEPKTGELCIKSIYFNSTTDTKSIKLNKFFISRQRSCGKVMFSVVSV